ncbi:hypothetical protein HanIR_Chr04g0206191 [Helianthus annuus]|nr:hypothetical protein HanIR_Chr04g0206191 [Helianthus annuus]
MCYSFPSDHEKSKYHVEVTYGQNILITLCHSPRSLSPGNGRPRTSFGGITLFTYLAAENSSGP